MPRSDNITPLIQKIARQANATFKGCGSGSSVDLDPDNKLFLEKQGELLNALVTAVRAVDLKIVPRNNKKTGPMIKQQQQQDPAAGPPVTYMHICETDTFSMGVFLLSSGASIPLHDHPGMHGMLKVLYGKVSIRCFDVLEEEASGDLTSDVNNSSSGGDRRPRSFDPPVPDSQRAHLRRSALRTVGDYSQDSGPCVLTPLRHNIHQIDAVDGAPAAFLDILAPPYDPDDGRDCHYYKVLKTVAAPAAGSESSKQQQEQDEGEKEMEIGDETWLLKIPQPEDFWCGGEPYPGPAVSF